MEAFGRPLALGLELSSLIVLSYWFHENVAQIFGTDPNITLAGLLGVSLIMWTVHAYFFFESKK